METKKITCQFLKGKIVTENSDEARDLFNLSCYGIIRRNKVELTLVEALYLLEKERIIILDGKKKEMDFEFLLQKSKKTEPHVWERYRAYADMRDRGYIVKTALKFGADFRVYDRGVKPGEDHAKWILYPVHEGEVLTWYEFSAKNRVANSTRKRLLLGVVDDEGDVSYWESRWMRP